MIDRGYIAESQSSDSNINETESTLNTNVERTSLPNIIKMEIVPTANEIPAPSSSSSMQNPEKKQQQQQQLHQLRIQLPALQLPASYHHQQQQQHQQQIHHPMIIQQQQQQQPSTHHHHQIIQTTTNNVSADQIRSPNSVTVVVIKTMLPDQ